MPIMNGETVLKKLKENPSFKTPVVALTADAVVEAREKYISEGFMDYIDMNIMKIDGTMFLAL